MASSTSFVKTILPNGIRILSEHVPYVESVSVGIWIIAGSVDENENQRGISHFMEHMLFKGTQRRSAAQIAMEMDYLGGHLNAFTDREYTCFYVKVLKEHLTKAMDILSDMTLESVFDTTELEREKNVVLEEIKRHVDTPEESVHDMLAEILWKGSSVGYPVIGLESVIESIKRDDLLAYKEENYKPDSIVISASGNVNHQQLVDIIYETFGKLNGKRVKRFNEVVETHSERRLVYKNSEQVHFCFGTKGYDQNSKKKYPLATIDTVLGGGMSSRLFQEIREKRGLAYSIGTYSASYLSAGLFAVYGGTSMDNFNLVVDLIETECEKIGKDSVTDLELERAKNQIRGALVLGQESMSNRMSRLAKSEIYFGRATRLDEIIKLITDVSKEDVANVASEIFSESNITLAAIGPFEKK